MNLVSVETARVSKSINPDNIGFDLDATSSESLFATVDTEPKNRRSGSPVLVPRSPRYSSSRGESLERRPVHRSKGLAQPVD